MVDAGDEARWWLTIDQAPIGLAMMDAQGRFLHVNRALADLLGYPPRELEGRSFEELSRPEDVEVERRERDRLAAGEVTQYRHRKRCRRRDGDEIWVEVQVSVVRDQEGHALHFVAQVSDVSDAVADAAARARITQDLRERAARLQDSNRDLEDFAMLASHDLLAPLSTVRGFLELLATESDPPLSAVQQDWVGRASESADRMADLLTSLLELSRVDAAPRVRVPVSLDDAVAQVVTDLSAQMTETGAQVEVEASLPEVPGDPTALRQLLQNLLQNALKYAVPGSAPSIRISCSEVPEGWEVVVADRGIGIPDAHKDSVFGVFSQVDRQSSGNGIGLATCRRIVEHQGGRIWIEDNPGGGTRVCFTLLR